jgi:ribosomal protein L15
MAKTGIFTQILGYDPEERKRKRQEEAARVSASLLSGDPYRAIGFSIGELFGAGVNKLFGSEDPEIKFQSTVRDAISSASQNYEAGSADYYKALAASLPQTSEYSNSIATARELAQKAGQEEEKQFRDTTKFVADNPEALTGEAQKLNARIAAKLRAAGVDPTQPLSRVNEMGVAEPIDPVYSEKVNQFIQALPETQRLNALSQAATRGSMKLDMDLNKPPDFVKTSEKFAAAASDLGFGVRVNLGDYSQAETKAVNNLLEKRGIRIAEASVPKSGEVKITDLSVANKLVTDLTGAAKDRLNTVNLAKTQLNLAKKGEGAALPQLQRQLVKLVGDSQIGQGEVRDALGSSGIVGDTISAVNKFMTGVPTADKLNSVEQVINALENINAQSFNKGRTQAEKILGEAKLSEDTRKALLPPAYTTAAEKKASKQGGKYVEGKVYVDAKGNRARYVNGKWIDEPIQ